MTEMTERKENFRRHGGMAPMSNDMINHPPHYVQANESQEPIAVIAAWKLGYCLGNVVKYVARAGKKGDAIEDLKKARWYLDKEIQLRERDAGVQKPSKPPAE